MFFCPLRQMLVGEQISFSVQALTDPHIKNTNVEQIVPETSVEALAIVKATFGDVDVQKSAIMLSMWHHLATHPHRDALLAGFSLAGETQTFMEAFLHAARARQHGAWPMLRTPVGVERDDLPMLESAFTRALYDVLGSLAAPMIINAWAEMVRAFFRELCRRTQASKQTS